MKMGGGSSVIHGQHDLKLNLPVLGFDGTGDVQVDLMKLNQGRLLVQGSSGSGKSHFLRQLCEQTCTRIPHLIFDWEGELHTLRDVHPYVLIGRSDGDFRADVEFDQATARVLCRRLTLAGASVIVDLSDQEFEDRRVYVSLYLDELMKVHARSARQRALFVILDEADEFCPQKGIVESSAAVIRLAARGRKRGFGLLLATRRVASLHKDVAEVQNRAFGLTTEDVDLKRSGENLGFSTSETRALKALEPGSFFVVGRAIGDGLVKLVATRADLKSKTISHDDYLPPPDLAEIKQALEGLVAESRGVAADADRTELLEQIARLESQLQAAKEGNFSDPADIRRAVDLATKPLEVTIVDLRLQMERARQHARAILLDAGELPPTEAPEDAADAPVEPETVSALVPIEEQMLAVLQGRGEMLSTDLAEATGQGKKSSTFRAHRKVLLELGLAVITRRGFIMATAEGDAE